MTIAADHVMQVLAAAVQGHHDEAAELVATIAAEGDQAVFAFCLAIASTAIELGLFGEGTGTAGFDVIDQDTGTPVNPDSMTGDGAAVAQAMRFTAAYANGDTDTCWALFAAYGDMGSTTWPAVLLGVARDLMRGNLVEQAKARPFRRCEECFASPLGEVWVPLSFDGPPGPGVGTYTSHRPGCARLFRGEAS